MGIFTELLGDPLMRAGLNYIAREAIKQYNPGTEEQPASSQRAVMPEIGEIPDLLRLKSMDGGVITLVGRPYTGKTVCAARVAEIMARPTYAVSPHETPPHWITPLDFPDIVDSSKLPRGSTLILDDILSYMTSKDYRDPLVREVEKIFPTARHERGLMLIVCTQVTSLMDKYGLRADALVCKPPDLVYGAVERPAIKRMFDALSGVWQDRPEPWIHRHAYFVGHSWQGVVRVRMPGVGVPR